MKRKPPQDRQIINLKAAWWMIKEKISQPFGEQPLQRKVSSAYQEKRASALANLKEEKGAALPPGAVPPEDTVSCVATHWLQLSPISRHHDPHLEGSLSHSSGIAASVLDPVTPPSPCSFQMKERAAATGLWCGQVPLSPPSSCGSRTLTSSRPGGQLQHPSL